MRKDSTSTHRFARPVTSRQLARCPVVANCCPVLRVRADCGGRLFTAKLRVVVHYLPHQLLDHLLADEAILPASHFCDCLRDRVDHFICFIGVDFA